MVDFILIVVLAAIIGGIILYLYRAKKRGETCIGCPHAKKCGGQFVRRTAFQLAGVPPIRRAI